MYINNNVINYKNVYSEEYNIISFNNNGKLEYLLVHEFDNNLGHNYLVIGKFTQNIQNIKVDGVIYKNTIKRVIEKYKYNYKELLKNNTYKYYEVAFLKNILFTKEGYDLITHKFLFTNNEIIRTIKIEQNNVDGINYYTNKYYSLEDEQNDSFKEFDYYEKFYTLRKEEYENLEINNIFNYVKANYYKIKNIVLLEEFEMDILKIILEAIEKIDNKVKCLKK